MDEDGGREEDDADGGARAQRQQHVGIAAAGQAGQADQHDHRNPKAAADALSPQAFGEEDCRLGLCRQTLGRPAQRHEGGPGDGQAEQIERHEFRRHAGLGGP